MSYTNYGFNLGTYNTGMPVTDSTDSTYRFSDSMAGYGGLSQDGSTPGLNPQQYQTLIDNNINPITGAPITPPSFADMTGLQKLSAGMNMAGNLANIWSGYQQNRLARDNFNFQKGIMNTNLANQIASYNTALEDTIRSRYSSREQEANPNLVSNYLERNRARNMMG